MRRTLVMCVGEGNAPFLLDAQVVLEIDLIVCIISV